MKTAQYYTGSKNIYYSVYDKRELRNKCKCGKCVDKDGFKTVLSTWHASCLKFTRDLDMARDIAGKDKENFVIFSQEHDWGGMDTFSDMKLVN
jgi:hypothetical protein